MSLGPSPPWHQSGHWECGVGFSAQKAVTPSGVPGVVPTPHQLLAVKQTTENTGRHKSERTAKQQGWVHRPYFSTF